MRIEFEYLVRLTRAETQWGVAYEILAKEPDVPIKEPLPGSAPISANEADVVQILTPDERTEDIG